jgi:hypothetical protein
MWAKLVEHAAPQKGRMVGKVNAETLVRREAFV